MKRIDHQVMAITGASSGIGLSLARRAAQAGARVFLIARNGEALSAACAEIERAGGQAAYAVADVAEEAELKAAAAAAVERFGGIDTWVNAAGVAIYQPLEATPREAHERLFRTNYWGVVNGALTAIPLLEARGGGALITVGSVVSDFGTPVLGAYAASKHAAKGFVDSLRMELLARGSRVALCLVKPSGIGTPITEHARNALDGEGRVPPPAYAPEVVARTILALAEHPRREVTVGGVGMLQTLAAVHFPRLTDRLAPLLIPFLDDQRVAKTQDDNLFRPRRDGRERSRTQGSRPFSLYTGARLHPGLTLGAGLVGAVALAGAWTAMRGARRRAA